LQEPYLIGLTNQRPQRLLSNKGTKEADVKGTHQLGRDVNEIKVLSPPKTRFDHERNYYSVKAARNPTQPASSGNLAVAKQSTCRPTAVHSSSE